MPMKQRFNTFIKNIKPTEPHLAEARRQTDYMVEKLHDVVAADKTFELLKVLRAGSNAKHTSLLRTNENVFDVDLGRVLLRHRSDEGEARHPPRVHPRQPLGNLQGPQGEEGLHDPQERGAREVPLRHRAVG